VKRMEPRSFVK